MFGVLFQSWALFLGFFLLMIGNGMQGTLLGLRGSIEGFSAVEMSYVMSAYFLGFLGGSRLAPVMIRRVGHIRVFAALASFISAVLILYPTITDPIAWGLLRVIFGFCFSGVYVTAESWLNNSATNETRGQSLSVYTIVMMGGIVASQYVILLGDASGFVMFILPSVLVSVAIAPMLLSATPTPAYERAKPMSLLAAFRFSPLSAVGTFFTGAVFAAQFGMTAVYDTADRRLRVCVLHRRSVVPVSGRLDRGPDRPAAPDPHACLLRRAFGDRCLRVLRCVSDIAGDEFPDRRVLEPALPAAHRLHERLPRGGRHGGGLGGASVSQRGRRHPRPGHRRLHDGHHRPPDVLGLPRRDASHAGRLCRVADAPASRRNAVRGKRLLRGDFPDQHHGRAGGGAGAVCRKCRTCRGIVMTRGPSTPSAL